ncbi:amidohydrolase family protein [Thalassotalea sp. HSM 43]|uniref:metal-dependent hydrolase family protein n=1 Tax=Thalassotalea sp. HSM 43 TaxID=2552945 RepID=UPI00107FE3CE|nr:amidohydrolase family protein [Thalassotalea sp. HSM 43]QBY04923.1 amidohydrolase family protein [Thalassotalea sp. HSM 43]
MKKVIYLIVCLIVSYDIAANEIPTLIQAKSYVDVDKGRLVSPANILIENGLIKAINPEQLPDKVHRIDLKNKILLPGLIDMHTHLDLDFDGSFDHILTKENASKGAIRAVRNAELTLMGGFTTVRNVGQGHITKDLTNVALSEAGKEGWVKAPSIFPAGHMVTIEGGHGDLTMGFAEGLIEIGPKHGVVNSVDDVVKAVRYQIKHGAKVIKIHATAGVLSLEDSVGAQQLTDLEMKAAVDEAHRHDIKVAAHAHGTQGIIAAIEAGVDSIEHGSLINDKAIELMKSNGTYLVPTTGLVEYLQPLLEKMHPKLREKAEYVLPLGKERLIQAIKSNVKIAMGSDAPLIPHGENAAEILALVARGMTHSQALQAATINATELLGVEDRGRIKVNLLADIIAVDENPLENIETVMNVSFVMKSGAVVKHTDKEQ